MVEAQPYVPDALAHVLPQLLECVRLGVAERLPRRIDAENHAAGDSGFDVLEQAPVLRIDVEQQPVLDA